MVYGADALVLHGGTSLAFAPQNKYSSIPICFFEPIHHDQPLADPTVDLPPLHHPISNNAVPKGLSPI